MKLVNFDIEPPAESRLGESNCFKVPPLQCNDTTHCTRDTQMEIVLNLNFPISVN